MAASMCIPKGMAVTSLKRIQHLRKGRKPKTLTRSPSETPPSPRPRFRAPLVRLGIPRPVAVHPFSRSPRAAWR